MKKKNICIIGARSVSAEELIKLLLNHRFVNIKLLVASEEVDIEEEHPGLRGLMNHMKTRVFNSEEALAEEIIKECDCVFFCGKAGVNTVLVGKMVDRTLSFLKERK